MTRNEAIRLLAREALLMFEHDGSSTLDGDTTLHIINQIFDYFGEQLQDKDDEIELLKHRIEEAMKHKTCSSCYWWNDFYTQCNDHDNALAGVNGYGCNRYETKDTQC